MHMGRKEFTRPFYPGSSRRTGGSNDGLAPVYSQMYPRTAGRHPVGGVIDDAAGFRRGRWYHQLLDDVDHIDIVALPQLDQIGWQKTFYYDLYNRLATL
jgi:hypothetical protein